VSLSLRVDLSGVERLVKRLEQLRHMGTRGLMDAVGAEVESQTRRRIAEEKESPQGDPWPAWSQDYAATRHGGHSLLQGEGHLLDSITYAVGISGDYAEVGSNLVYAAIHQFGGQAGRNRAVTIPDRPYLGLSEDNLRDLAGLVDDWADRQMESLWA